MSGNNGSLPDPVREAAEAIRLATRSLTQAAETGDAEGIQKAIVDRDQAVKRLQRALADNGHLLDRQGKRRLLESLAFQASDAEASLRSCVKTCGDQLHAMRHSNESLRAYIRLDDDPSALDCEG